MTDKRVKLPPHSRCRSNRRRSESTISRKCRWATRRSRHGRRPSAACSAEAEMRGRLPGAGRHPRLPGAGRRGQVRRGGPEDQGTNCLPAVCGRVCPQETQCEGQCVLGKKGEPVAIGRAGAVRRRLRARARPGRTARTAAATGKKVAVVGSGPAGLTVAGDLIRLGHEVTVFEAFHQAGGVLMYGIPEFRLPKDDRRGGGRLSAAAGRANRVEPGHRQVDHRRRIAGRRGLRRRVHRRRRGPAASHGHARREPRRRLLGQRVPDPRQPDEGLRISRLRHAGRSAGARCAWWAEATWPWTPPARPGVSAPKTSTILYRRSREEMPARAEEIHHAEQEGIDFQAALCTPMEYLGDEPGMVPAGPLPGDGAGRARRFRPPAAGAQAGREVAARHRSGDRGHRLRAPTRS